MSERDAKKPKAPTSGVTRRSDASTLRRACACGQHTVGGGECEACRKEREGAPQRAASTGAANSASPTVHAAPRAPGQPLDTATRAFMEPRFGHDFSQVRLHTDERAAELAASMEARAVTSGNDIWLGRQSASPATSDGRRLLAHELTHVVQQRNGRAAGSSHAADDGRLEHEARTSAATIAHGGLTQVRQGAGAGTVQLSPLRDRLDIGMARGGKSEVFDVLRARGIGGPIAVDPDVGPWLDAAFGSNTNAATMTDDRWLADRLIQYGSEPHWPRDALLERERRAHGNNWRPEPGNIEGTFGVGPGRTQIQAYYFPGTSNRRAMIVGGVHGSEAAGVEVVNLLLQRMRAPGATMPFYSVIIVPVLFPENLAAGRRKTPGQADPNRQMPAIGTPPGTRDTQNRPIEPENLVLLDLVERFQPERIASVHGHSPPRPGGSDMPSITDDPRAGHESEDDALALNMARRASSMPGGARVPGNRLGTPGETSRYPTSSAPHEPGVTFGEYGSHATPTRPAMNVITIETYGNETSAQARHSAARRVELESLATVLRDIFLGPP